MEHDIFASQVDYETAFAAGLEAMLEHDGLGVFILVCANALMDDALRERLWPKLQRRFEQSRNDYRELLRQGGRVSDSDDDLIVFLKMALVGFDSIEPVSLRGVGPWELQYNPLRAFRPARMANSVVEGISRPFNRDGFHFNKPFLRKEAFWRGELAEVQVELLYNKFPFVAGHGLLVPEREAELPQFLIEDMHRAMWRLCEEQGGTLPLGVAYNSIGGYASVNHLHFQPFVRSEPLPLESSQWRHNGGGEDYPVDCHRFDDYEASWLFIEELHRQECPYNLLYRPGLLYCLPRKGQGSYEPSHWSGGSAWYELCGGVVTFSLSDYADLTGQDVEMELTKLAR